MKHTEGGSAVYYIIQKIFENKKGWRLLVLKQILYLCKKISL
jgi:hypothetical protein